MGYKERLTHCSFTKEDLNWRRKNFHRLLKLKVRIKNRSGHCNTLCNNMCSWLKQHVQCDVFVCSVPLLCISWLRCSYFLLADVWVCKVHLEKKLLFHLRGILHKTQVLFKWILELTKNIAGVFEKHICLPTSDQSRASHSGGQLLLLQGSVSEGRGGVQAESSRTFSSVEEILLLHKTSRVRRPLLQLRLHSDHSPVHQLKTERSP